MYNNLITNVMYNLFFIYPRFVLFSQALSDGAQLIDVEDRGTDGNVIWKIVPLLISKTFCFTLVIHDEHMVPFACS